MKKIWQVFGGFMTALGIFVFALWLIAAVGTGKFYFYYGPKQVTCTPVDTSERIETPTLQDI